MTPRFLQGAVLAGEAAALLLALAWALRGIRRRSLGLGWEAAAVFVAVAAIYVLSSLTAAPGPWRESPHPHYVRLAEAILHGRLHLLQPVFEVAVHEGRIYVIEPVFPAILMAPFVALWDGRFSDVLFVLLVAAMNATLVYALWQKLRAWEEFSAMPAASAYWLTALFAFGTPHWYLAIAGRVWHTEAIVAVWCLLLAMHEAVGRHRSVLMHALLGCACLCYPPLAFSLPFFWWVAIHQLRRNGVPPPAIARRLAAGLAVLGTQILIGWAGYNYVRFGNPFEAGLSECYRHDVAIGISPPDGMFNLTHLPAHAALALLRLPAWQPQFPFVRLDAVGFSLFLATPALVYAAFAVRRGTLSLAGWMGALPVLLCLFMYHQHGSTQFGYRRVVYVLPFLLILAALGMQRCRWRLARPLIVLSMGVNLIGVVWFYAYH